MSQVKEVKDKLDIVSVVSEYVQLKKAGGSYLGRCPFHNEKSPSFNVSDTRQSWHCFGCGLGGDVFDFVQKIEGSDFGETLEALAKKAGVVLLKDINVGKYDKDKNLFRINQFIAKLYNRILQEDVRAEKARNYIASRGIDLKTVSDWGVGYAPDSFDYLIKVAKQKKINIDDMKSVGLVSMSDRGKLYDRFRDRVTFPIHDERGNVVGFTARSLGAGKDVAKYMNSPQSSIYDKSGVLFGLHKSRASVRQKDFIVIVEGQMDCIKSYTSGVDNVIATSGTALSDKQVELIKKYSTNIILAFDNDAAGIAACDKAALKFIEQGIHCKVASCDPYKDADEMISKDPVLWKNLLQSPLWYIDYKSNIIAREYPYGSIEQKKEIIQLLSAYVSLLIDPIEKDHYARKISEGFGIDHAQVKQLLSKKVVEKKPVDKKTEFESLESAKMCLALIITFPDLVPIYSNDYMTGLFGDNEYGVYIEKIFLGEDYNISDKLASELQFMVEYNKLSVFGEEVKKEFSKIFYSKLLALVKKKLDGLSLAVQSSGDNKSLGEELSFLVNKRINIEKFL